MLGLKLFILFTLTLLSSAKSIADEYDDHELKWPEKYSFEVKKLYVGNNLVEDFKVWHTEKRSRIDYNGGAVQSVVVPTISRKNYGVKYEIQPETDDNMNFHITCYKIKGTRSKSQEVEDILPGTYGYIPTVNETMDDIPVTKFVQQENGYWGSKSDKETLWATYSEDFEAWLPLKYEHLEYNDWLGNLEKREIWEFYNFEKSFSDDIFDVYSNYNCTEIKDDDTLITKDLLFMDPEKDHHVDHVFKAFKSKYNRRYTDKDEHNMRRSILQHNMRLIHLTNRQNLGYKLAVNEFADRTPEEMEKHKGLLRRKPGAVGNIPFPYGKKNIKQLVEELPTDYDARLYGLVSTVKHQQDCGSCWTYGTTTALEGAIARSNGGQLINLSNQALIDCAWPYGAKGCLGGSDNAAYDWMKDYGLPTIAEYGEYKNRVGYCHITNMTKLYSISGYTDVTPNSVDALKLALIHHGPVSASVHVNDAFKAYSNGIFSDPSCSSTDLDHEISLVGYGEQNGDTFWILKNSWGPNWGIDGYMHISAKGNVCGVMTEPTYVVI